MSIKKTYNFFSKDELPAVCTNEWCVMFTLLTVMLAIIFACIEIEIEGPCGWADKLPTPSTGANKKSLTIYHYLIFMLMFLVFSSIFFTRLTKSGLLSVRIFSSDLPVEPSIIFDAFVLRSITEKIFISR